MAVILYSFVAENDSVIADYTSPQSYDSDDSVNLDLIARNHLAKIPRGNCQGFNVILGYYFYYHVKNGLVVSCVTPSKENSDLPKKYLVELDSKITTQILNNTATRGETLTKLLSKLVNEYNNTNRRLKSIESSLMYTTDTLRENINNILERGELIDTIVTKSGNLKQETKLLRDSAKYTNSSFLTKFIYDNIKNKRIYIVITVGFVAVFFYLFMVAEAD